MAVLIINSQEKPKEASGEGVESVRARVRAFVGRLLKQFPALFSAGGMVFMFYTILWVYSKKSPGYNLGRLGFSGYN